MSAGAVCCIGFLAVQLADHLALVQFTVPDAFVAQRQFHFGAGGHAMNVQRLALPGDPQRTGRIVTCQNSPERIGIRVVVELSAQSVHLCDELPRRLVRCAHETDVARKPLPAAAARSPATDWLEGQHLGGMLGDPGLGHGPSTRGPPTYAWETTTQ